jgi:DNA-binding response OmpR family regulator
METKKLIDCCEFISDGDHLPPPKSDSGVPFITISNITGQNKLSFEDTMFVPESYYNGLNENKKAQKGDILYSVVGSFGKPVYVDFDKQMVFQRHIAILRPKRNVNARFIYYTMLNPQFYKLVDKLAIGCSQRTVTLDTLRNIEVNLPDKDIQDKMVGILSLIDEKIANNNAINDYLSGEFEVTAFNDGMSAIQKITSYDEYALALIDLMLPDISGMEIIKIIRKVSKIPIIIITAKDNDIDKSLGLNLGADDYVVKPFSLIELTARIKANIRRARTYQALPNNSIIKIKDIEIDPHSHMVQRKGVTIDLTPIEFQILYILASHPGQAYSKERLYELIWKEPYFGNENVLNTHINRLRLKLKSNAEDSTAYVKTLWGIGYKMEEK